MSSVGLPLFDVQAAVRRCECRICRDFRVFHATNPDVYRDLVSIIGRAMVPWRQRWSIGAAAEVYRWERLRETKRPEDDFKINNNFRSRYVRMILIGEPRFRGFLKMRRLHTPGCVADEIFESIVGPIVDDGVDGRA